MKPVRCMFLIVILTLTLVTGCNQPMTEIPVAPTSTAAIPTDTEVPPAETVAAQSVSSDAERIIAPEIPAGTIFQ